MGLYQARKAKGPPFSGFPMRHTQILLFLGLTKPKGETSGTNRLGQGWENRDHFCDTGRPSELLTLQAIETTAPARWMPTYCKSESRETHSNLP